jgi:monoamine oxidase
MHVGAFVPALNGIASRRTVVVRILNTIVVPHHCHPERSRGIWVLVCAVPNGMAAPGVEGASSFMMSSESADVIVIGAGVAGLAAAGDLTRAGLSVCILEARNRLGGRIHTLHDPRSGHPVELGAEFIHGKPPEIWETMSVHPAEIYEGMGTDFCARQGKLCACDFFDPVYAVMQKMRDCQDPDRSFMDFINSDCAGKVSDEVKRRAIAFVSGFNAADPAQISVRSLVAQNDADQRIEGDRAFRLRNGYYTLVEALAADLDQRRINIHLETVVTKVEWQNAGVRVHGNSSRLGNADFNAPRTLVTLPLGVLHARAGEAGAVEFVPALTSKQSALDLLVMGAALRVTISFRERFWDTMQSDDGRSGADLHFLFTEDESFPTWWTLSPLKAPILTLWAPAQAACRLAGQPELLIVQEALAAIARQLHLDSARCESLAEGAWVHDWQTDIFSRGAYSYAKVGGIDAPLHLAEPVAGTLFFAGEATDVSGHSGTVHGAIASGRRAAQEILAGIGQHDR